MSDTDQPSLPTVPGEGSGMPRGAPAEIEFDLSQMGPWREYAVVLHNDEVHSDVEVVIQIVKALHCSFSRAQELMLTAHRMGRATVAITDRERAFRIAGVLRQIDLQVTLRQIN